MEERKPPHTPCGRMSSIDPRGARFSQGVVGVGALIAFVLDAPLLLPVLALALAAGAILGPQANPLALVWRHGVVPALRLGPPRATRNGAPVRFAMGVGLVALAAASLLVLGEIAPVVGWGLALVVAGLALLAAATDLCVGCKIFVLLARWRPRPTR